MSVNSRTTVLIPGYMLNEMLWREFEAYLASDCRVYHASVTGGRTLQDIAQHMITLLPETFSLIGFSLGGYIARQLAADFVAYFIRVRAALSEKRKLALADTTTRWFFAGLYYSLRKRN